MSEAKRKSLDEIAAEAGKFALRYADKMIYEMAGAVTDHYMPLGADELARALYTGQAFSPSVNTLEPTDLPQHGDPSVWGAKVEPTIADPEPNPAMASDNPQVWNGLKMNGQAELARRAPSTQEPASMEPIGPSIDDLITDGRDDFVAMLQNPMTGVQAPEPGPEPEPEPEPDLEPEF